MKIKDQVKRNKETRIKEVKKLISYVRFLKNLGEDLDNLSSFPKHPIVSALINGADPKIIKEEITTSLYRINTLCTKNGKTIIDYKEFL